MNKQKFLVVVALVIFSICSEGGAIERYDTLGDQVVSTSNLLQVVAKAPDDVEVEIKEWFLQHPDAYEVLIRQDGFLHDAGYLYMKASNFFDYYEDVYNWGLMNYTFQLPRTRYLLKISSALVRFKYTASQLGLGCSWGYCFRWMKDYNGKICMRYRGLDEDRVRLQECFKLCCSEPFLNQKPSPDQLQGLCKMVCGVFPHSTIRFYLYEALLEKYFQEDSAFRPQTFQKAFDMLVSAAYKMVPDLCYRKCDIFGHRIGDSYTAASRVFHSCRFAQAIDGSGLHRLEKPPTCYICSINDERPESCEDKDILFVQRMLDNHEPLKYYLDNTSEGLDAIFDQETTLQFLAAAKYAGIWDITEDNIFINCSTGKVTFIDFEHAHDTTEQELFNVSRKRRIKNLCDVIARCLRLFPQDSIQERAILQFVAQDEDIDMDMVQREAPMAAVGIQMSPLGRLMGYDDFMGEDEQCVHLRGAVLRELQKQKKKSSVSQFFSHFKRIFF